LLDGVGRARQLAIANRTTVYMVFVPTNFWLSPFASPTTWTNSLTPAQLSAAVNLCDKQLSGYTFIANGAVGDQPGQHAWHYLTPWQALPDNSFIASWKFLPRTTTNYITDPNLAGPYIISGFDTVRVPFPTQDSTSFLFLPYIAFNYLGQLTTAQLTPSPSTVDEYIPLARGSVLPAMDPSTKALQFSLPDVSETPPGNSTSSAYNIVDIDPLTGRATLRFEKVQ
jgi:hypothetical protein